MAGIYERIKPTAADRLSVHKLRSVLYLRALNAATDQQALDTLNEGLGSPLSGAELTDLTNILTQLNAQSGTTNKLLYFMRVESVGILVEGGASLLTESAFRSLLGIA